MKLVFVDEDQDQRETFTLLLQSCFPDNPAPLEVIGVEPKRNIADMQYLVEDKDIVTIILDEQLKDSGEAQYFGIDLASYLRGLNKKIPIYILTSFPDSEELSDGAMDVEDILDKQTIYKIKPIVGARILRRINSYLDISSEREIRFEQLLRKSVEDSLTEAETTELKELNYLRSAPTEVDEIISEEHSKKIDDLYKTIKQIEEKLANNG